MERLPPSFGRALARCCVGGPPLHTLPGRTLLPLVVAKKSSGDSPGDGAREAEQHQNCQIPLYLGNLGLCTLSTQAYSMYLCR